MYPAYMQPTIQPQQILQANGKASIEAMRMPPNSSVLVADQTAPIIWKCVSDSLGNVSATAYDVTPHKGEEEIREETLNKCLMEINERLSRLEKANESYTVKPAKPTNGTTQANVQHDARSEKPTGYANTINK